MQTLRFSKRALWLKRTAAKSSSTLLKLKTIYDLVVVVETAVSMWKIPPPPPPPPKREDCQGLCSAQSATTDQQQQQQNRHSPAPDRIRQQRQQQPKLATNNNNSKRATPKPQPQSQTKHITRANSRGKGEEKRETYESVTRPSSSNGDDHHHRRRSWQIILGQCNLTGALCTEHCAHTHTLVCVENGGYC